MLVFITFGNTTDTELGKYFPAKQNQIKTF